MKTISMKSGTHESGAVNTTPAMPELPETTYSLFYEEPGDLEGEGCQYVLDDPGYTADQMRAYAIATLQAQPAEVSDAEIDKLHDSMFPPPAFESARIGVRAFARAILALRPQSESAAPTVEAAREMGAKGGPVVEAERLAFEAWMAGHCWAVSPTWNGKTYDDSEEDKKRKLLGPLARTTRMLWAAWRDRAALSSLRPQAVPMTDEQISAMGRSCIAAWVSIAPGSDLHRIVRAVEAHHGITAPAGGEG